jgi:hypothetical protein
MIEETKEESPLDVSLLNMTQPCFTVNFDNINELISPEIKKGGDKYLDTKSGEKKIKKLKDLNIINERNQEKTPTLNRKETVKETTPKEKMSITERDKSPSIIVKKNRNNNLNKSVIVESTATNKLESKSDNKKSPEIKGSNLMKKDKIKSENTKLKESGNTINKHHQHNNSVLEKSILLNQSGGKKEHKASVTYNKKLSISMIIDPKEINKVETRKSPRHSMLEQDTKRLQIKKEMRRGSAKSTLKTTKSSDVPISSTTQKEVEGKIVIDLKIQI